jgi:putative ABC transport system substrate-binding protein
MIGVTLISRDISEKRLELLKETAPAIRRVGVVLDESTPAQRASLADFEQAARRLKLETRALEIYKRDAIESAVLGARRLGTDAIAVVPSSMSSANRKLLVAAIAKARRPAIYPFASFAAVGGLLSYGPSTSDSLRQVAFQIDKILKGAKPADLPILQPTNFEMVLNLRAARAIGLSIPEPVLLRASKVIE